MGTMRNYKGRRKIVKPKVVSSQLSCESCIWLVWHGNKKKGNEIPYCANKHDYIKTLEVCEYYKDKNYELGNV